MNYNLVLFYWQKKYESINEYSLDEDHDDYFYNWLENDIISALNNQLPLFKGLTTEFSNILKRIHNKNVTTYIDFDELDMQDDSKYNVDLYFDVLNASELKELDRRLEIYNYRLDSGFLAVPF